MQEKRILTQNDMTSREIMQHPAMEGLDEGEKQKLTVLALAFQNLEKDKPIPFSDLRVRVKRRDDHNPETRSTK